jgi:hypothetical protein
LGIESQLHCRFFFAHNRIRSLVIPDLNTFAMLPLAYLKAKLVLPVRRDEHGVLVALSDPADIFLIDDLKRRLKGRVHLAVAPRCNIQCAFCERKICANLTMQHPGWAHQLLSPIEAVELVRHLAHSRPGESFVVGVAGPGEPLANAETFEALGRVHKEYPALIKCVSTNGLLLEQRLPHLLDAGVTALDRKSVV